MPLTALKKIHHDPPWIGSFDVSKARRTRLFLAFIRGDAISTGQQIRVSHTLEAPFWTSVLDRMTGNLSATRLRPLFTTATVTLQQRQACPLSIFPPISTNPGPLCGIIRYEIRLCRPFGAYYRTGGRCTEKAARGLLEAVLGAVATPAPTATATSTSLETSSSLTCFKISSVII